MKQFKDITLKDIIIINYKNKIKEWKEKGFDVQEYEKHFVVFNEKGNEVYYEDCNGYWERWEYDDNGNEVYYEDCNGYWERWEYDDNGNEVYYENSKGDGWKILEDGKKLKMKNGKFFINGNEVKVLDSNK